MNDFVRADDLSSRSLLKTLRQRPLITGTALSLRLWQAAPPRQTTPEAWLQFETVVYVIAGRAELRIGDQRIELKPGDCWRVPKGVSHNFSILEAFTAVEAIDCVTQPHDSPKTDLNGQISSQNAHITQPHDLLKTDLNGQVPSQNGHVNPGALRIRDLEMDGDLNGGPPNKDQSCRDPT